MESSLVIKNKVDVTLNSLSKLAFPAMIIMYIAVFVVFSFPRFESITGPIIALCMFCLTFTDYYYSIVAVLIMGNNSLENVFMGKIQFYYFVTVLIILRIFLRNSYVIRKKYLLYTFILALIFSHYLIVEGANTFRPVLMTILMFICLLYVLNDFGDDKEKLFAFLFHIGLTIFVSALSCVVFGGIRYHNTDYGIRYGISGAGAGDPNFSGIYLVTGFSIILQNTKMKWYLKVPMLLIMVLAIAKTMSITAFLLLCVTIIMYFIVEKTIEKTFFAILLFICIVSFVVFMYQTFPVLHNEYIEAYKARIMDKFLGYSTSGSMSSLTTGRTYLFSEYWKNFQQQYPLKLLFGGNKLLLEGVEYAGDELVSHNTYIDLLRRYGIIPTLAFLTVILSKFFKSLKICIINKSDDGLFLLKLIYLIAAFTVTIHRGESYVLWLSFLVIL